MFINSCATREQGTKGIPTFLSQENDAYYVNLVFNYIPNHNFYLDDELVSQDEIKYSKSDFGHLIKIPVDFNHQDLKVKSALKTLVHKKIFLKEEAKKIMMLASYSRPVLEAIQKENPQIIVAFAPPETIYYKEKDFFENPLFFQEVLRPLFVIGHSHFKENSNFPDFSITNLTHRLFIDRPTFLTHYLPFTYPNYSEELELISEQLSKSEFPVIFLSSSPTNLIQQIPRGRLAIPTYEFSVKNHFLALSQELSSPWELITDHRSDYLTIELAFIDAYWHVLINGKDQSQDLVFGRDLTLYQTKPKEGRNRRNAR